MGGPCGLTSAPTSRRRSIGSRPGRFRSGRSPIKKVASLDAGSLVRLADAKPARERGTVTVTIGSPSQGVAEAIEVGTEIVVTVQ